MSIAWIAWLGVAVAAEPEIPHERYTLENGLEVILVPDHSTPIVHTNVWYHVGSLDEEPGRSGFAHLFEHLMFQGSENAQGEYFAPLQRVGANLNGSTNTDRTDYWETVPAQYLELALFLESDRMGWLLPALDQGKLDNQREVVRNERRQRYENRPYGDVWMYIASNMYPEGHPYHHTTIGSHEDLEAASLEDVKNFFRRWYVPANASLVVAGDFDEATVKDTIAKYFASVPAGDKPEHAEVAPVHLAETKVVELRDDVPDQKLWMTWHSPAFFAPGDAELDLFSNFLCGGKDAAMYKELVIEQGLFRDIGCAQSSSKLSSEFFLYGTVETGKSVDDAVAGIDKVIAAALETGPTAEDLQTAIASFENGFYGGLATIYGKAATLQRYLYYTGTTDYLTQDLGRYLEATPESVLDVAKQTLTQPRVEIRYLPEEK